MTDPQQLRAIVTAWWEDTFVNDYVIDRSGNYRNAEDCIEDIVVRARAALADEPAAPAPPADGEVAELVAWLRMQGEAQKPSPNSLLCEKTKNELNANGSRLTRAAELLQRQALVPVSVSERLPGLWECLPWPQPSDKGCWCWMGRTVRGFYGNYVIWEQVSVVPMCREVYTHWLPAHALPLPEASE